MNDVINYFIPLLFAASIGFLVGQSYTLKQMKRNDSNA